MQQDLWLTWELTKREIAQRYRGTFLGILWPMLYAGLFLAIFSFVFTVVLRVRWGQSGENMATGSLMIFCGMVPYLFVAEVMGRSPGIMLASANLVKRVRFPVHLIPVVSINAALIIAAINLALLLAFAFAVGEADAFAVLFLPLILVPLYLFALGIGWLFSSVAVFFRDLGQIAPVLVQVMMFMAPVFYPASIIPADFLPYFAVNPLTYFVEAFRSALGGQFDVALWLQMVALHGGIAALGWLVFHRLRPAFGDLL
ncbi:ABC transporter permease [Azospirillum himalayense]|uniref:Transport permease protein n=1 Tax=Azospirillum himalayense TaxID=654847 RepID=A0ABW0G048_9PROT